jgi:hypothetical protein
LFTNPFSLNTRVSFVTHGQVTAALHGKGADRPLVDALQRLYLDCLAADVTPRLRSDPDRKAARLADPSRFPHIASLLDGKA